MKPLAFIYSLILSGTLVLFINPASAQFAAPPTPPAVALAGATAALSVTTTSASVAVPSGATSLDSVWLLNDGGQEVFVALGSASVTATTGSLPLPPGAGVSLYLGANTYVAAITASGSSTLKATLVNGALAVVGTGNSSGGGGSVTQGTVPWQVSPDTALAWGIAVVGSSFPANANAVCMLDSNSNCSSPHIDGNGALQVAGEAAAGVNPAGDPVYIAGLGTDGNQHAPETDSSGRLVVNQGVAGSPWPIYYDAQASGGYSYSHISTDTTTDVKSGSGVLHTITVNTAASSGTITIYDNTAASGTVIGVITATTTQTYRFDVQFSTGLTIVTATAAPDITVSYK